MISMDNVGDLENGIAEIDTGGQHSLLGFDALRFGDIIFLSVRHLIIHLFELPE